MAIKEAIVSAQWLNSNLDDPDIKVLDASWYMPQDNRDPFEEYQAAHIPGALFFDIDKISDPNTTLPHMLPSEEAFAAAVSVLGIENKNKVIVYDGKGLYSAARAWWMFRVFGHDEVYVLDGGFPQWKNCGFKIENNPSSDAISKSKASIQAVETVYKGNSVEPVTFKAKFQPHLLWDLGKIKQNVDAQTHQHIDARPKGRFDGVAPEPRKGVRSGHIPNSKSIPFTDMVDSIQMFLTKDELQKRFDQEGISMDRPIVLSCASGVTACIVALGFHRIGKTDVPVYDGSWTEWEAQPDATIITSVDNS